MASSVNRVILIGSVGKDPVIVKTKDGKDIANFSLAMNESWKGKDGVNQNRTEWVNISVFGGLASVIKNYVKKGSKLYVEGSLQTTKYLDKEGKDCWATKVIVQGFGGNIQMLDSKKNNQDSEASIDQCTSDDLDEDEIPF